MAHVLATIIHWAIQFLLKFYGVDGTGVGHYHPLGNTIFVQYVTTTGDLVQLKIFMETYALKINSIYVNM